jgi:hypothetical protein
MVRATAGSGIPSAITGAERANCTLLPPKPVRTPGSATSACPLTVTVRRLEQRSEGVLLQHPSGHVAGCLGVGTVSVGPARMKVLLAKTAVMSSFPGLVNVMRRQPNPTPC